MPDIDYAALAQQNGAIASQPAGGTVDYESLAKQNGAVSSQQPSFWDKAVDAVKSYASGVGEQVNPVAILKGAASAAAHPLHTASALGQAQGAVGQKAIDSFKSGDYAAGVRHAIGWLLPVVGPQIDAMGDEMATNPAHALGSATGLGLTMAAPESPVVQAGVKKLGSVPLVPKLGTSNPATAAAVKFGQDNGIPVSAATATGNGYVAGVQKLADSSPLGSIVAQSAKGAEAKAFTRVGGELADQVHPNPVVPETAGRAIGNRLDQTIADLKQDADASYGDFRFEANHPRNAVSVPAGPPDANGVVPMQDMQMPVDVRGLKQTLKPQFDDMQWMPAADRNSSAGYQAVKNILQGPDYIPATSAELGLGGLKSLSRDAASPDLRTMSQGIGANSSSQLQGLIDQAAAKAGPDTLEALQRGRAAHAEKMATADVMNKLRDEPVQLFNQATYANDAGIDQLRAVAKVAPAEMPLIGRAYLEKLLGTATADGGFDKARTIASQWEKLGPATKQILYKNPMLVDGLDNFFHLAKRAADNPNPSGTAHVLTIAGVGGAAGTWSVFHPLTGASTVIGAGALAKMLHSPKAVAALTDGLRVSLGPNKAAAAIAAQRILKLAGPDAKPLVSAPAADTSPAEQNGQTAEVPPLR